MIFDLKTESTVTRDAFSNFSKLTCSFFIELFPLQNLILQNKSKALKKIIKIIKKPIILTITKALL